MTEQEKNEIVQQVLEELKKPVKMSCEIMEGATKPFYANPGDAGMDLRANADIEIAPMETKIVPTGFKVVIPEGFVVDIRPRSGLSAKTPLKVNLGTIDEGYRGEYGIIITNYSPVETATQHWTIDDKGKFGTFHIKKGDRIAQIVLSRYYKMDLVEIDSVESIAGNRGGGFGSSGMK